MWMVMWIVDCGWARMGKDGQRSKRKQARRGESGGRDGVIDDR